MSDITEAITAEKTITEVVQPVETPEVPAVVETQPEAVIGEKSADTSLTPIPGTVIKSVDGNPDRFEGYAIIWGDEKNRDLQGEYFTKSTYLGLDWPMPVRPSIYHHSADPVVGDTLIGLVDKAVPDEVGLWVEGELSKANRYKDGVRTLLNKGALRFSTGTLPRAKRVTKSGEITRWPIIEYTMTPTPAESRLPPINLVHLSDEQAVSSAYKALNLDTSVFVDLLQDGNGEDGKKTVSDTHAKALETDTTDTPPNEGESMSDEQLTAALVRVLPGVLAAVKQKEAEAMAAVAEQDKPAESESAAEETPAEKPDESTKAQEVKSVPDTLVTSTKSLPVPQANDNPAITPTRIEIIRATKYSDLSPQDMSFLAEVLYNPKNSESWRPTREFQLELADKVTKSVVKGILPASAALPLQEMGYYKSNELDTTGQSQFGSEWVNDSWRSELWVRVRQDNIVAPLFPFVEMATNPYELPIETGDPQVFYVPETTDISQLALTAGNTTPSSKVGSDKIQMNAKKFSLRISWSSELNEDSLIPIISNYRRQAVRAMQNAIDNVIVNGDVATGPNVNVNLIDGTPTAMTKYLAFNGLRKYCLVTNPLQKKDSGGGSATLSLMRNARFKMAGQYALQSRDLAWIVDDNTYGALLDMPEFLTMDKAGNAATNLTGQIGVIDGIPVFATAEMGLSGADGKNSATPANNAFGQAICVFRPNFMIGYRRQVNANVEFFPWADAYHLVVTVRLCMVSFDGQSAAELFNIAV